MTNSRRLLAVLSVLGFVALVSSSRSLGDDPAPGKRVPVAGRPQIQPDKEAALAQSKFAQGGMLTYRTLKDENLFALQVQPKLKPVERRNRDYLILISASAAQAGESWTVSEQITERMIAQAKDAGRDDRISIWVVSTPKATKCLTKEFLSPRDAGEAKTLQMAVAELKDAIYPAGAADLKSGLGKAIESFKNQPEKRQRVLLFLGDGQSTHDPIGSADRTNLAKEMVQARIGLFSVPLGINLNPENLHGLATGTGGAVLRIKVGEESVSEAMKRYEEAFAAPVMYDAQLKLPPEITEVYPQQLPPVRSDIPTLVVGRMKPAKSISYSVTGTVPGGDGQVIALASEDVREPELDNYFLSSMVTQWAKAKTQPALIRADRALAFAFEQTRLQHEEMLLGAQIAVERFEWDAAMRLFEDARQLAPHDPLAAAGIKVVTDLKSGKLTPDKIREVEKQQRKAQKLERVNGVVRWTAAELAALAQVEQEPKEGGAAAGNQDDLLRAHRDRLIIEEQKMAQIVDANLRQARRELANDPDGAVDLLRVTLARVNDHPDLSKNVRDALISRLETGLREAATQGRAIKLRKNEGNATIATIQKLNKEEEQRKSYQDRVEAQFRVFKSLMYLARVEEKTKHDLIYALESMAADARLKNQPVPVVAKAAYDMTLAGYNLRKQQDLKRLREERFLAVYLEVEKSHVPFPDEPGIYFPPLATWKAIRDIRKEKYEVNSLPDDPEGRKESNKVAKLLTEIIDMKDFQNPMTLKEAIGLLSDKMVARNKGDLPIWIDSAAFKEENAEAPEVYDTQIKFPPFPRTMTLATALRVALSQIPTQNATYLIRRNFIEVTTNERQLRQKVLRVYPVGDLVIPISQTGGTQTLNSGGGGFAGQIGGGGFAGIGGGIGGIGGGFGGIGGGIGGGFGGGFGQFGQVGGIGQFGQIGGIGGQFGQFGQIGGFGGQFGQIGGIGQIGAIGAIGAGGGVGQFGNFQGVSGSFNGGSFQGGFNGSLGSLGATQAVSLISVITKVVAPGEWFVTQQPNPFQTNVFFPFGGVAGAAGAAGNAGGGNFGAVGGGPPPPPVEQGGPADIQQANTIEFFPPALALIVRGTSRLHTSATGGLISGKQKRLDAAAMNDAPNRGLDQVGPNGEIKVAGNANNAKRPAIVKVDTKGKKKEDLDPTKIWNEALAKGDVSAGMVVATADFLFEAGHYNQAAEFLKANLRQGIVVRPWVYEALAVALEASGGDQEEISRARLSAVALDPKDAQGFIQAARTMADHKQFDRALAFCRQAALLEPNLSQPYAEALAYADLGKDSKAMEWAVGNLVSHDWPSDNLGLHLKAQTRLTTLAQTLTKDNRKTEADRLTQALTLLKQRDLVINLSWETPAGETADLDLEVKEPTGSICSPKQKQTPGGGTLLGTSLEQNTSSSYTAAQAFSGDYEVTVRRNWGQPLGNRARLVIIQNYGTAKETRRLESVRLDQKQTIKVHLGSGRRTELASVPPPVAPKQEAKDEPNTNALVKLREFAHPDFSGATIRGSAGTPGARTPSPSQPAKANQQPSYQSPMTSFGSSALNLTAQMRLASGGEASLVVQPVFQTAGTGSRAAVNLPLIPGASNP